jgi:hypothetical protein
MIKATIHVHLTILSIKIFMQMQEICFLEQPANGFNGQKKDMLLPIDHTGR